jgi:tetratricopeptide (TPR) repeat protein
MLEGAAQKHFEELNTAGQSAKDAGNHEGALAAFDEADRVAGIHDDSLKRMHALTPAARALWSLGRYEEATGRLQTASDIAAELGLSDERGITFSNIGRIAAVKTLRTVPVQDQASTLKQEAAPKFRDAYELLKGHPHLYYRYANAQHGAVVAAMAGERKLANKLVIEGAKVAFQRSEQPYDHIRTYKISPKGLVQLLAAAALIPFGRRTPVLAGFARSRLIR